MCDFSYNVFFLYNFVIDFSPLFHSSDFLYASKYIKVLWIIIDGESFNFFLPF